MRPDGASIVLWKEARVLVWDATCLDTLAPSYLSIATAEAGAVAREAEHQKQVKYSHLEGSHYFIPIAIETLGAMGHKVRSFLKELAQRIHLATEDNQAHHHLIQRLSVAVQRKRSGSLGCIVVGLVSLL